MAQEIKRDEHGRAFLEDNIRDIKVDYTYKNLTDDEITHMQDKELNTCDKCNVVKSTYSLVWIDSEDFCPFVGEKLPKSAYKKYSALCKPCYEDIVIRDPKKFKRVRQDCE